MLHAGLDLSRRKLDVCLLSDQGTHLDQLAVPPDVESLKGNPALSSHAARLGVIPEPVVSSGPP